MHTNVAATVCFIVYIASSIASPVNWEYYHRTDQILDFFKDVSQKLPNKARYEDVQDPDSQFKLPLVTITDFASGISGKEVILVVASEHAKELITAEVVYWLGALLTGYRAEEFAEWASSQPVQATAWKSGWTKETLSEWAEQVLKKVVFKIFPVQNIAGRKAVESGGTCLRTTLAGVDLNRNWPVAWIKGEEGTDEFGGSAPFSEPETRIVRLVAENLQPSAFINLHSGEWAMYVPWDSKKEVAPSLPTDAHELLEKMNSFCKCMRGAAGQVAGYLAMGTSMDWMYAEQHVPYPLTLEVFGPQGLGKLANGGHPRRRLQAEEQQQHMATDPLNISVPFRSGFALKRVPHRREVLSTALCGITNAPKPGLFAKQAELQGSGLQDDCMRAFNPLTQEEYQSTVASWMGAFLVLADHLLLHPHASAASHKAEQQQLPEPDTPPTKQELLRLEDQVHRAAHDVTSKGFKGARDLTLGRKAGGVEGGPELDPTSSRVGSAIVVALIVIMLLVLLMVAWVKLRPAEAPYAARRRSL